MAKRGKKNQDGQTLTEALHALLPQLEDDLRERPEAEPEIRRALEVEHKAALEAHRTGQTFNQWRDEVVTQIAVAWTLACVFVRFLEDNELVTVPRISGPVASTNRRQRAIEEQDQYFERNATHNERDYLEATFRDFAKLPALGAILGATNAHLWRFGPSDAGAKLLIEFFRRLDDASAEPRLRFEFVDPEWSTRFLGDLYQNLSEDAQKRFALLQTPEFVEEFILDRTLDPALAEFGLAGFRMIDPTVGSGHFLLGGFKRLLNRWQEAEPGTETRVLVQRVLDSLYGVDLNPFAVEICRFRLLIAALKASGVRRLADAPDFRMNVVVGDSLLHGKRFNAELRGTQLEFAEVAVHTYRHEAPAEVAKVLGQQYHAVVGNPPYITVKDKALNEVYRERYGSCKGKYQLGVPFLERFVELALPRDGARAAGFVGQITSNAFMKREFGSKLIEEFMPTWDLTHVIDTSGAYIPGHGTPTVILFLRNQQPVSDKVRAVLGICGEPTTPTDPAHGLVWRAIVDQVDRAGSQSDYVSVEDKDRDGFHHHPWSIGGGGASDLKDALDETVPKTLQNVVELIGVLGMTNADDVMLAPIGAFARRGVESSVVAPICSGDELRDWQVACAQEAVFPYSREELVQISSAPGLRRWMWACRTPLGNRATFSKRTYFAERRPWWEWHQIALERTRVRLSIAYAEIATHNHFVLDRGGRVFKQTAPIIKLPAGASEDDHLALLGLLNSSTACFWLRQVCQPKGGDHVGNEGARVVPTPWEERHAFNATNLLEFPVPQELPLELARRLQRCADALARIRECSWVRDANVREVASAQRLAHATCIGELVALQEELDWQAYRAFGLVDESLCVPSDASLPTLALGERAFEIAMARGNYKCAGEEAWFKRHGSSPITEPPSHWNGHHRWYRELVERRIRAIETNRELGLIERPEFKRRWNLESFDLVLRRAVRERLLDLVEELPGWKADHPEPISVRTIAEQLAARADVQALVACYLDWNVPEIERVLAELLEAECVPYLSALRYKDSGLRKRSDWERTWELQRREDEIDALVALPKGVPERIDEAEAKRRRQREIGDIPVPPKYTSADFQRSSYWSNRGKLDVPKERFISYPFASPDNDGTLLFGWAGWDHKQQAAALGAHYMKMRDAGWEPERLRPLLAGIAEILPWVKQWHADEPDLAPFYEQFLESECARLGLQRHELAAWRPPQKKRGKSKKKSSTDTQESLLEEDAG